MFSILPPDSAVVPVPVIWKEPVVFDKARPLLPPVAVTEVSTTLRAILPAAPAMSIAVRMKP